MDYKKMIKDYANAGGDEKKMWASVDVTEEAMEYIKETNPDKYNCLMRKLSETLHGKHYSEEYAVHDVAQLHYTDAANVKHHGAHWTLEEIETDTKDKTFPAGTTKWDKYVAYNNTYADMCSKFDETQILCIAYLMWFGDEDWKSDGKIWDYMSINR